MMWGNYLCSWNIFKLRSLINSNVMTNQLQARTIALFYCNASVEPQQDDTHATVDHDSIVPTLYGIVMVNFTLVTCSRHSIRLVSTTFSNKSTILILSYLSSTCLLYSSHYLFVWPNSWFFFVSTNRVVIKLRCTLSLAVAHWKCTCAISLTRLRLS